MRGGAALTACGNAEQMDLWCSFGARAPTDRAAHVAFAAGCRVETKILDHVARLRRQRCGLVEAAQAGNRTGVALRAVARRGKPRLGRAKLHGALIGDAVGALIDARLQRPSARTAAARGHRSCTRIARPPSTDRLRRPRNALFGAIVASCALRMPPVMRSCRIEVLDAVRPSRVSSRRNTSATNSTAPCCRRKS